MEEYDNLAVTMCRLDESGEIVEYDMCSESSIAHISYPAFKPIGPGVIYSINGVLQKLSEKKYFYVRKNKIDDPRP